MTTQKNADDGSVRLGYSTDLGKAFSAKVEDALAHADFQSMAGSVDLLLTSPPFPLVKKKSYGNETGETYLAWLRDLAPLFSKLLSPTGSLVIEIGNAWVPGEPEMSTLPLEALFEFKRSADLHLCQHVICHNPARLPTPAAWVSVDRVRLKDSFTHVWWMSNTTRPKADNRRVLNPYSKDMKALLSKRSYNSGSRPSGHVISEAGFLTDHGGSIGPNVLEFAEDKFPEALLKYSGTQWDKGYRNYCSENGLPAHPARMQAGLAAFFIQFLTDEGDLVFDPFAGSNTTGAVAEQLDRRWVSVEADDAFVRGSQGRFDLDDLQIDELISGK